MFRLVVSSDMGLEIANWWLLCFTFEIAHLLTFGKAELFFRHDYDEICQICGLGEELYFFAFRNLHQHCNLSYE